MGLFFVGLIASIAVRNVKERIALAYNLSNGRVLEDPRFMICTELLHIPAPQVALPSFARTVTKCIDIARRANSFDELVRTGVPYKGRRVRINAISVLSEVMAGPKTDWIKTVENMADESYPAWRANLQATGKRLPATQTEGLERRSTWIALRPTYVKALLGWLGGSIEPSLVDKLSTRLDATLEFVTFVTQEFLLLRNYKPVKLKHITYGLITKRGQPAPVVMWSQECDRRNRAVVS